MLMGPDLDFIKMVKKTLADRFKITDLGPVKLYLGIKITRDRVRRTLNITQTAAIKKVLK